MPQKKQGLFLRHCLCYLQQYFLHLAVDSEKLGYVLEMTASEHIEKLRDGLNYRQSLRRTYGLRRQSLRRVVSLLYKSCHGIFIEVKDDCPALCCFNRSSIFSVMPL
jgi:hypothetical protein